MFKWLLNDLLLTLKNNEGFADTTTTTLSECIPTIVAAAELELNEKDIVRPLVLNVPFPGPGVTHQTPFVQRLVSEADDALTSQALNSTGSDETSPSEATVGVHGSYVQLKEIADLGSVDNMAIVAGTLIAQSIVTRRELDLLNLAGAFTTDQGGAASDWAPADIYDAYGSLRSNLAPLPYHLIVDPLHIWMSKGIISLFDGTSDSIGAAGQPGSVSEDFARSGFAGMVLGFNLWADANVPNTSNVGTGMAISNKAIKYVSKRGMKFVVESDAPNVADKIVGSEIWGEAILRNLFGNAMTFDTVA